MDLVELKQKLIAAARSHPPSDRVPHAFEKRVMHLLRAKPVLDEWALWSRALWRSAAACLALVTVLGFVSYFTPAAAPPSGTNDLSQDFENTMLAAVDQDSDYQP
jgi:hypothetical protein